MALWSLVGGPKRAMVEPPTAEEALIFDTRPPLWTRSAALAKRKLSWKTTLGDAPDLGLRNHRFQNIAFYFTTRPSLRRKNRILAQDLCSPDRCAESPPFYHKF